MEESGFKHYKIKKKKNIDAKTSVDLCTNSRLQGINKEVFNPTKGTITR
jgi:hypothetical protein